MNGKLSVTNLKPESFVDILTACSSCHQECEQTLLLVAMYYWGHMPLEVKGWGGVLLPLCLLITAVQQPGTSSPTSQWSNLLRLSSGYAGPPSSSARVPRHSSALVSPPTGSGGGYFVHVLLHLMSSSSPSQASRHPSVQSCHQSPSCLSNVDLTTAACDAIYHTGLFSQR